MLDIHENISLLDIGCGSGWAIGQIAKLAGDKDIFYGVDLSPKMIEKAIENFKGRENFHFLIANAEKIPLDDNQFDIITCTNSFHHYLHPDKALAEMHRLLKHGGRIHILDPTVDNWFLKIMTRILNPFDPTQVRLYSTGEFKEMISAAGFKYAGTKMVKMRQKVHMGEKV